MTPSPPHAPIPEPWDLWLDENHEPAWNMAADEVLLTRAAARGRPLLRFYGWDRPAVTIGYVQNHDAAPAAGYTVIRRPTGGGVVFHDHDITYTAVFPPGHWLTRLDRMESYATVNRAVAAGLARIRIGAALANAEISGHVDRGRMVCFTNPTRYDLLQGERKIAGSAQRRTRQGILHQGSIVLPPGTAPDRMLVTDAIAAGFQTVLGAHFQPFQPETAFTGAAEERAQTVYRTEAWNRRR